MKQSENVVYKYFQHMNENEEDFSIDQFNKLDLRALSQLLGTFMPIVKLEKENMY